MKFPEITDKYILIARIAPISVSALPLFFSISSWFSFDQFSLKLISGTGILSLGSYALANLARGAGQTLQAKLWASWGGPPSVRMLRHRDQTFPPAIKSQIHQTLVDLKIIERLPTPSEENVNFAEADIQYFQCSEWLRKYALAHKKITPFDIVHSENIDYGYQRNTMAVRPYAITISISAIFITVAAFYFGKQPWIEILAELSLATYFFLGVGERPVRQAADNYSRRLIDSIDAIKNMQPSNRNRKTTKRSSNKEPQ